MASQAIHIRCFGPFSVAIGDLPIRSLERGKPADVLRRLALASGGSVHGERLIEDIWMGLPVENALHRLHQAVYDIRRTIRRAGGSPEILESVGSSYRLARRPDLTIDVDQFTGLLDNLRSQQSSRIDQLQTAVDLYRGDLLIDAPFDESVVDLRAALRTRYIAAAEELSIALVERGEPYLAARYAAALLVTEPWHEAACRALMLSYAARGEPALAARTFREFANRLFRDLGREPGPLAQRLVREITTGSTGEFSPARR